MSYSLEITQDDRAASLVITLTEDAPQGLAFSFDISIFATDVRNTDISLLSGGSSSTTSQVVNATLTASSSGTFVGPLLAGTPLLAYEFEVLEAGEITVTSFNATRDGGAVDVPDLPSFDLDVPQPLRADMILGDFEVGETLSVDNGALPDFGFISEQTLEYTWFRDGVIQRVGPDEATYLIGPDDDGAEISLRVAYTDSNLIDRVVLSNDDEIVGEGADPNIGTTGDDFITGDAEDSFLDGREGDDSIFGGGGSDTISGDLGTDTAVYSGPQSGYTVYLSPITTRIDDRTTGRDGIDFLNGVERLKFEGDAAIPDFELERFDSGATLSAPEYQAIIELYIAYYDRAPDALGLNFWANAFAEGTTLDEMAALFAPQPETLAAYPPGTSSLDFATTVYSNVLGRTPDQVGLEFWVGVLETGAVARETFILEVLNGAKAAPPADATQGFIDQQIADQAYLETKTDIGTYFAVTRGLSNTDEATAVMALFDGSTASALDAATATNNALARAVDADTGEFIMQVLGVLENPFPDTI